MNYCGALSRQEHKSSSQLIVRRRTYIVAVKTVDSVMALYSCRRQHRNVAQGKTTLGVLLSKLGLHRINLARPISSCTFFCKSMMHRTHRIIRITHMRAYFFGTIYFILLFPLRYSLVPLLLLLPTFVDIFVTHCKHCEIAQITPHHDGDPLFALTLI